MERWWQARDLSFLNEVLPLINSFAERENPVDAAFDLFLALNRTWTEYNRFSSNAGASDHDSIKRLLLSLGSEDRNILLTSGEIQSLVRFNPQIMNHDTLRKHDYDPQNIPSKLQKQAQNEHRQLVNAYSEYQKNVSNESEERVIKKLAQILFVVRSNIAHGEKTSKGPDFQKRVRDELVCQVTTPAVRLILELIYDHPTTRLAVYGTLAPGQSNQSLLEQVTGKWLEGIVKGHINTLNNFNYFSWDIHGDNISVEVFFSKHLPQVLREVDKFEGGEYRRILLPVLIVDIPVVVQIYSARNPEFIFKQVKERK